MKKTLYAVQMNVADGDPTRNIIHIDEMLASSDCGKGSIVCLPELVNTGYDWKAIAELSAPDAESFIHSLAEIARKYAIWLVGGSVADSYGDLRTNTTYDFAPSGEIIGSYSKIHLFPLILERDRFSAGNALRMVDLDGVITGNAICYDLRFPELFRRLTLDGAVLFTLPAAWPLIRADAWRILSIARAIENQCYMLACNRAGCDLNGVEYGDSLIVDPWGNVVAEASGSEEAVLKAEFDMDEVQKERMVLPALKDRRPDVYRLDWDMAIDTVVNDYTEK
jgi:predicted amidohydrolase